MHLFRTAPLVEALARDEIDGEEQARYLLASSLLWLVTFYTGFIWSSGSLWSVPLVAEGLAIGLVHLIGISKCLDSAGGRANQRFVLEFSCLYPAVSLTSVAAVGGTHWLIRLGFEEAIERLSVSNMGLAINLSTIGTDLFGLLLFVANVGLQALIYWRLQRLLQEVQQRKR